MNRKQLKSLISAGVFSAALLSGVGYAEETSASSTTTAPPPSAPTAAPDASGTTQVNQPVPAPTDPSNAPDLKKTTADKSAASHACGGAGGCGSDQGGK